MGHLNLQRESFRDHFNICFVFLLTKFSLTYFNRRATDFFDWRSGVFKLENRGFALYKLGRIEEAIISCNKSLEIKPNYANLFYNKACYLALQNEVYLALENLKQAITLNPDKYRNMAKTDAELDNLRQYPRFRVLIQ